MARLMSAKCYEQTTYRERAAVTYLEVTLHVLGGPDIDLDIVLFLVDAPLRRRRARRRSMGS